MKFNGISFAPKQVAPRKVLNAPTYYKLQADEPHQHITEDYVCTPPALRIVDQAGTVWALGMISHGVSGGEYTFDVMRDGVRTGEIANRIERRNGKIYIFGPEGRKAWNGRSFI